MRTTLTCKTRLARPAFTLIELMVVVAIIAIVLAIGAAAYLRTVPEAQNRVAAEHLRTLAGAIQIYQQEKRDYPVMRLADIAGLAPRVPAPQLTVSEDRQSVEALVYQLQYLSDAGKALSSLPQKVFRQGGPATTGDTVTEGGQVRPLYVVYDPWGNPVQYIRPREPTPSVPNYPLSAGSLNNRVLLVSMGPDGVPGNASDSSNQPTWNDPPGGQMYPNPVALGKGDDIVVEVGATR